ncbi:MAG: hypothetical protein K8H88_19745 [Sandaracinaceae bacterium]|nr:hypothetical protein [Sandaracinaceae bacterium]
MAELEITVETNPSSNLLILDCGSIEKHPAWRLREPDGAGPAIPITINDDDPITFATRLADEYAYLHVELLRAGKSSEQALDWIDRAREASLRSRFTVDLRSNPELIHRLEADLR